MNLIDRYIGRTIIEATLLAMLVLIGMQSFIGFVAELHDIGHGHYGILQALLYVPMTMPTYLYQFFPIAGLLGVMMGLGRLASRSELIAMRAAGVSVSKVLFAVFKAAIVMLIIVTFLGEYVAPRLQYAADNRKSMEKDGIPLIVTAQSSWVRDGANFIHINQVLPHGIVLGIMRFHFDKHRLTAVSYADNGQYKHGIWEFNNIVQTTFNKDHVSSETFPQQKWDVTFNPRLLGMAVIDPSQTSLPRLYKYIQYLKANNQSSSATEFEFWQRIFQPFATLIILALGVPFIFGPLRTTSMGLRILVGIIVGFLFYMLNQFFGPLSMVYQLPPILAALLPTLLFGLLGIILLLLEAG